MKVMRVIAVFMAVMCGIASANLLTNPGFETGDTSSWDAGGWYIGSGGDAQSGAYGLAYYVPPSTGGDSWFVAYQLAPVTEGLTYDASCWMRYAGTANNSEQFLEIQWLNGLGEIMWGNGVGSTPVSGPQEYTFYELDDLVAPAGAVQASVRAVVHTTGVTTDNAWHTFDNFSFQQAIPEPSTMALIGIAVGVLGLTRRRK